MIKRGEIGNRFYILASGEVAVIGEDGSELSRLKEGSSFGEKALINDDVRKVGGEQPKPHIKPWTLKP